MRFLATMDGRKQTERFVAYLLSQTISTHVEKTNEQSDKWDVWIREEDRLVQAKSIWAEFVASPDDAKFIDAVSKAESIIEEGRKKKADIRRIRTGREVFRNDLTSGKVPPLTLALLLIAIFVSLATRFGQNDDSKTFGGKLLQRSIFVDPVLYGKTGDSAASLKRAEYWRVFTPIFPHGNPFHILFNGLMLVALGRIIERLEGPIKYAFIVFTIAVLSNLLQGLMPESLMGSAIFFGLSGVTYGLFGYIWIKTTLDPGLGITIAPGMVLIMLMWLLITMSGLFDLPVANMAHLGGLLVGTGLAALFHFTGRNRSTV
jgi:GlpG protein